MTKIIVTPIDMSARGSYRERQKLMRLWAQVGTVGTGADLPAFVSAMDNLEAVVVRHAETDDGTPVAEALENASAEDFDALVLALMGVGVETIPNASRAS